jgi:hypothetical protein
MTKRRSKTSAVIIGPPSYENWNAFLRGEPSVLATEHVLFTDADVRGVVKTGPYRILNTGSHGTSGPLLRAAAVLRIDFHIDPEKLSERPLDRTDDTAYHGGDIADEIVALVSLASGVRLKAGGVTRIFRGSEPRGFPVDDGKPAPVLLFDYATGASPNAGAHILPNACGVHSVAVGDVLAKVGELSRLAAMAVIRSARLYQDAMWLAESQPNLTWLLLVSALETAANFWQAERGNAGERLSAARPELFQALLNVGGKDHAEYVAGVIEPSLGSTKKFVDFVSTFLPSPPSHRPPKPQQFDFSSGSVEKMLRIVYGYRSNALHSGRPFPEPLCQPSWEQHNWAAPAERVSDIFTAVAMAGGVWQSKDLPISLNTFEYIARNALSKWWLSLVD